MKYLSNYKLCKIIREGLRNPLKKDEAFEAFRVLNNNNKILKEDLNKCISLLKDYQFYMHDIPCPVCGEDNLIILDDFITYLEKKYGK